MWVLLWSAVLLAALACSASPSIVVALNTFKWLRHTSDKFLGLSVTPGLLSSPHNNYSATTLTMLQGLAPTYLRVGGNDAFQLNFETPKTNTSGENTLTESRWASLNQLATDAGLRLIFSINLSEAGQGNNESRNSMVMNNTSLQRLLSLSNQQGYDPVWQYGYQTLLMNRTNQFSGKYLARDVIALRKLLDSFPRYQKTVILGPAFIIDDKSKDLHFLQDFMVESNEIVNVLMLQINTQSKGNSEVDVLRSLSEPVLTMSKMLRMPSQSGRPKQLTKKQLWIVESDTEGYTGQFLDAVSWAVKLGHAGKLGYHVILRRPTQLAKPTPDYWVSLLYRNLVGSAVLSTRLMSGDSAVTVFANCAAYYKRAARSALDPTAEYERGAVVVWGVNRAQESVRVTLLTVSQEYAHVYTLTASPEEMERGKTLLNGKQLSITHGFLPKLTPNIQSISHNMSVQVPACSVFFILLPHAGARACLSPAVLSRREDLVNPQWEKWRNIKTLMSTGRLQDDFIVERGGIYESSEDAQNNRGALKSGLVNSKDNVNNKDGKLKEREMLGKQQNVEDINKYQKKSFSETDTLLDDSKIKTNGDIIETALVVNKGTQEDNRNIDVENALTDLKNNSEGTTSALHKNSIFTDEEKRKLENTRVKRSDTLSSSGINTNYLPQVETSPLYRKLHYLQRKKPIANSNFPPVIDFKPLLLTNETVPKNLSPLNNETKTNKTNTLYVNLLSLDDIMKKTKPASKLSESIGKEVENFHYQPGAFYETLGNLKIDSNLSLADIEEQRDAFEVLLKESEKCEDCKSTLQVTKRPANQEEVDRKIVHSGITEYIEQYLKNTDDFKKQNRLCTHGSNKLMIGETEHGSVSNAGEDGQVQKPKTIADAKEAKDVASADTSQNFSSKNPFTVERNVESLSLKTMERIKRGTESFKYIAQIFNKNSSEEPSNNNSTEISHPREMQLRMFLQELTEEGEELLKSFDDEYEQLNKLKNNSDQSKPVFNVFSSVSNKSIERNGDKKTSTIDEGSENDFYTKTNLITNYTTKPKRKYNSNVPVNYLYRSKNVANTLKVQNVKLVEPKNATLEPLEDIAKGTEKLSTTPNPLELDEFSSTETIPDLNSYSKLELVGEQISEPNKNSVLNSLTPKSVLHFLRSYDNSKLNQEYNSKEIKYPGTTIIRPLSILKPFQEEGIIMPTIKTFTTLKLDELDQNDSKESNTPRTDANIYLNIKVPDEQFSESSHIPSPYSANSRLFQPPFKNYNNIKRDQYLQSKSPGSTMSSQIAQKHLQGETKNLPDQTYSNQDGTKNTDIKGSRIISTLSGTPNVKNSLFKKDPTENEFYGREVKTNQLNNLALNLKSQGDANEKQLLVNQNIKRINFQNTPSRLNKVNKTTGSIKETKSPVSVMLLNKQKERLAAFKERLKKAREHLQNLTHIHPIPNFPTLKLSNTHTKNVISDLNGDINREDILNQPKQPSLLAVESNISVKKQLNTNDVSLPNGSDLINRKKRQVSILEGEKPELTTVHSVMLESPSSVMLLNDESVPDIVLESSYTPIHKWIIPLSNHTERIVMKNKIFPVKLFGVLSDDWQDQSGKKEKALKDSERKSRSVQYSCMRDHFDDYSAERDNLEGITVEKDIKEVSHPSLLSNDNLTEKNPVISSPENVNRKKRSAKNEDNMNNDNITSHLTNEIIKEGLSNKANVESESNVIIDHKTNNYTFGSMLQKKVAEIMKSKAGVNRMFELAKLYQKTTPKSKTLEVFNGDINIKGIKNTNSETDNSEQKNKALKVSDIKETTNQIYPDSSEQTNVELLFGKLNYTNVKEQSSSQQNTSEATTENSTTKESSKTSKKNTLSILLGSVQVFFETVKTVFRKLFNNVKPLKPA